MNTILILSDDVDMAKVYVFILEKANYSALHVETVEQIFHVSHNFDYIILSRPFNLSSEDWNKLKEIKHDRDGIPIVILDSPKTEWLGSKSSEIGVDMILPFPCDLTKELPKLLDAHFGK